MEPFSTQTSGFISLLASQSSPFPDCDPPQAVANSPGLMKPASKRKWSTKEDLVLISGWVNTSKDPIVSNEQKITSFWRRIEAYVNSSPLLTGSAPREWGQCKQRWGRVNDQVCKFVGSYDAALKHQSSGQNDDDVMKAAHEIFFNDYQAKFTMEHLEDERQGYILANTSEFESGESNRSSKVRRRESVNVDMLNIRNLVRDPQIHERLKADLVENVWAKFGDRSD
ncbi:PREDICTED: glutathione S-transferase T3-like [Brassica oleracea var. oleracea]|uniref:Myb-like domain-containing protein n=1 Tax=Brassica oleracea var. oleracea TaxID=109376 RepID=A0A0D3CJZ2_BRAOL|nr:PREDICTED: glutathione S-transferase T3-like [Brassica oleracea var. oleracea]XP_013617008.1 PREDICTED: glutathione S-transferase T3-like [Brassica oleracea var. oleracea]XP_013617822.1 PREDICTED: glutathione S-transferase T3-like [Brassica oleracea var. oleracea]